MSDTIESAEVVNPQTLATRPETGAVGSALQPEQIIHPPITAAQAKTDAVAALTLSAYSRAAMLEITQEESDALLADFPDDAFKPGAAGKENLIYIEHAFLRDRFTGVFGMGKWAIIPRNRWAEPFQTKAWPGKPSIEGSRVYVEAMLIIRGCFVGEAVGAMEYYPSNAAQNYGDAVEGAKTAAFRRCAKEFGVGLQAWKKDWCAGWWERKNAGNRRPAPAAPPAPAPTPAAAPPPATKAKKAPLTMANSSTRARFLEVLGCQEEGPEKDLLKRFLVALGWLPPDKEVEQLHYRFVPLDKEEMEKFQVAFGLWKLNADTPGHKPISPYAPHGLDPSTLDPHPVAPPVAAPAPAPAAEPAWRSFIMPFGKLRGKTLGELTPDEIAFYMDFQVSETYEVRGVTHQHSPETIASQRALRAALDQAKQTTKG